MRNHIEKEIQIETCCLDIDTEIEIESLARLKKELRQRWIQRKTQRQKYIDRDRFGVIDTSINPERYNIRNKKDKGRDRSIYRDRGRDRDRARGGYRDNDGYRGRDRDRDR